MKLKIVLPLISALSCLLCTVPTTAATSNAPNHKLGWMEQKVDISNIQAANPGGSLDQIFFNNDQTIALGTKAAAILPDAIPAVYYTSYASFSADMASGAVPPNVKYVAYDCENWAYTPPEEQKDPQKYMRLFYQLAHTANLKVIQTPAINLADVVWPQGPGNKYQKWIKLNFAAVTAKYADIYEIQGQQLCNSPSDYESFVDTCVSQAKGSNQNVIIYAGLSPNWPQGSATAAQLYQEVQSTRSSITGYWLNAVTPASGPIAVEFLIKLLGSQSAL